MIDLHELPPPENEYLAARRRYVEPYGRLAVMNTYLKIALVCQCIVMLALVVLNVKTYSAFHNVPPLVVRIDSLGRAEAVNYGSLDYHPQDAEIRYFLAHFVQGYYGRMRATVRDSYPHSLYFLDGRLADAVMEANKKSKTIETFLTGQSEEIDIDVKNVAIEDLRKAPYKAAVDLERVYYNAADHTELRRERGTANIVFVVKQPVPNALVPFNPLGLTITYFRLDQAFAGEKQ